MFDQAAARRIVAHMNEDHADALLLYLAAFNGVTDCTSARMLSIDARGIDIEYQTAESTACARVLFESPLENPAQARQQLVHMVHLARAIQRD